MVSQRSNIKGERPWKTWLSKRPQGLWFRDGGILGLRAFWRTHKHIMTILLWVLLYPWFPHSTRKKKLFQKFIYFRSSWFSPILILIPNFFSLLQLEPEMCVYLHNVYKQVRKGFFTLWSTNLSLERILLFLLQLPTSWVPWTGRRIHVMISFSMLVVHGIENMWFLKIDLPFLPLRSWLINYKLS